MYFWGNLPSDTFTDEEDKRFWCRYEEGFDIPTDDEYNAWLEFQGLTMSGTPLNVQEMILIWVTPSWA